LSTRSLLLLFISPFHPLLHFLHPCPLPLFSISPPPYLPALLHPPLRLVPPPLPLPESLLLSCSFSFLPRSTPSLFLNSRTLLFSFLPYRLLPTHHPLFPFSLPPLSLPLSFSEPFHSPPLRYPRPLSSSPFLLFPPPPPPIPPVALPTLPTHLLPPFPFSLLSNIPSFALP